MYQISLLQALASGYYDGVISVKKLKEIADTAIGTFEGADGEMIMLDNIVYKAKVDGIITIASDDELIPFSNATKFKSAEDITISAKNIKSFKKGLKAYLKNFDNMFITLKINGLFKQITVRSIPKQTKPYKPLDYIVDNEQKVYTHKNIEGVIVGFLNPSFMKDLNTTDFHMHFISSNKLYGGHVLDFEFDNLDVSVSVDSELKLILPNTKEFNNRNFSVDKDVIKKIEE